LKVRNNKEQIAEMPENVRPSIKNHKNHKTCMNMNLENLEEPSQKKRRVDGPDTTSAAVDARKDQQGE
jgi:hypothetical protein